MKVGIKLVTIPQAHFHFDFLIFVPLSCPKRFEWMKMTLDTGAAVNTFPLYFGPGGARDGRFYRTASVSLMVELGSFKVR